MSMRPHAGIPFFLMMAFALLLVPQDAWAQGIGTLVCNAGLATGKLFQPSAACPTALSMDNLFSFLVCNFEQLSGDLLGSMFCGMIDSLSGVVTAALLLFTVLFGIGFTIGVIPMTGRDAFIFLIKFVFISAFATHADIILNYIFGLSTAVMRTGETIALQLVSTTGISTPDDIYKELDKFLSLIFHLASDAEGSKGLNAANHNTEADLCKNAVFAVLFFFLAVLPVVAYTAILLIARLLMAFFRAVFAYIYAIVGTAFLLTLSPFFLCFFLFRTTAHLSEKWLGYLVSFAFQVVLLFSFLSFVILIEREVEKNNIVQNISHVIMYNSEAPEAASLRFKLQYCTLCDFQVVRRGTSTPMDSHDPDYSALGELQCIKVNGAEKPITPTWVSSPDGTNIIQKLLDFLGRGLIQLIILAIIVENLLRLIPNYAQQLASSLGAVYAPALGGGVDTYGPSVALPGESIIHDASVGFERGFGRNLSGDAGSGISRSIDGISGAVEGALKGTYKGQQDPASSGGVANTFSRWLNDPNRTGF